jgi:hypothetical protein
MTHALMSGSGGHRRAAVLLRSATRRLSHIAHQLLPRPSGPPGLLRAGQYQPDRPMLMTAVHGGHSYTHHAR